MPQTRKTRTALVPLTDLESAGAVAVRVASTSLRPFDLERLRTHVGTLARMPRVETEDGPVLSLQTPAQNAAVTEAVRELAQYRKDLKASKGYQQAKTQIEMASADLVRWLRTHEDPAQRAEKLGRAAVEAFRKREAEEAAQAAREAARREAEKRQREADKVAKAAKKKRGANREALLSELEDLQASAPDPEVEAERARQEALRSGSGKGRGSMAKHYDIVIDDLGALVAAVVASDPRLLDLAKGIARDRSLPKIPLDALNVARTPKHQGADPKPGKWIAEYVASHEGKVSIPGVIVRQDERFRNI